MVGGAKITSIGDPEDVAFTPSGGTSAAALEFPAQRVWSLLPSVYSVLSIPIVAIDSTRQSVSGTITARRTYRDQPVSNLLDCGSSLAGPNADNNRVTIRLTSQVDATGTGTSRLRTSVDASGTSSAGATTRCWSTGTLELQILNRLREGLTQ